jgi:broad specificity phosphatase PhoE
MAQVVRLPDFNQFVDHDLDRLLKHWRTVPELADEWPEWDEYSRVDYIIEWPIMRETFVRVAKAAKAGILNERQQRDWQELQQLIETHRATMEWMLEGPI